MRKYKGSKAKRIQNFLDKDMTILEIAIKLKISPQAVYGYIKNHELKRHDVDKLVDNKIQGSIIKKR